MPTSGPKDTNHHAEDAHFSIVVSVVLNVLSAGSATGATVQPSGPGGAGHTPLNSR